MSKALIYIAGLILAGIVFFALFNRKQEGPRTISTLLGAEPSMFQAENMFGGLGEDIASGTPVSGGGRFFQR